MTPVEKQLLRLDAWIAAPMHTVRIELVRVVAPLAILGYAASRVAHADEWLGEGWFRVPKLPHGPLQAFFLPGLPVALAWLVAGLLVVSGLLTSLGLRTRKSVVVFGLTLAFVALADRPSAMILGKLAPVVCFALACSPAGERFGFDAWRAGARGKPPGPAVAPLGAMRFLQAFVLVYAFGSGVAQAGGEWLTTPCIIFSMLHDSYQTPVALFAAEHVPAGVWSAAQYAILVVELGAPILLVDRRTRALTLALGLTANVCLGLLLGPMVWFALVMGTLLLAGFGSDAWASRLDKAASRWMGSRPRTSRG